MKWTARNLLIFVLLGVIVTASLVIMLGGEDVLRKTREPEGYFNIRDVDVKPLTVTTSTAELNITAYIDHRGGSSKDLKMLVRAISISSGLLESEKTASLPEVAGRRTINASQRLTLKRQGGYTIKILLFSSGAIVEEGSLTISGLEDLEPASRKTGVQVEDTDFIVRNVTGRKVQIQANLYLTNIGSVTSPDLKLMVKAREINSNIIGDQAWTKTGNIPPEATIIRSVNLTLPVENNYIVDALLWKNETLAGRWQKTLFLAPTRTIPKDLKEEKTKIKVSDFTKGPAAPRGRNIYTSESEARDRGVPTPAATPGFTAIIAITILILAAAQRRRWKN